LVGGSPRDPTSAVGVPASERQLELIRHLMRAGDRNAGPPIGEVENRARDRYVIGENGNVSHDPGAPNGSAVVVHSLPFQPAFCCGAVPRFGSPRQMTSVVLFSSNS
jgi:hypothetical protein